MQPPADVGSVRKVTAMELLRIREQTWERLLRGCSLVAEAKIKDAHSEQVAKVLGKVYAHWTARGRRVADIFRNWPACVAVAVTGVAVRSYEQGTFWPYFWRALGYPGDVEDQTVWGQGFVAALAKLGLPTFPDMPMSYLGPILMHTGIPTFCLEDYFRLLLQRRVREPGLDAESFLAWATAPGCEHRLYGLDVPARRFLEHGTDYALDFVERSLDLLERLQDPALDLDGVGLPERVVARARELAAEGRLDLTARPRSRTGLTGRWERPRIALDPFGRGVEVVLPAISDTPDGLAVWNVTAAGTTATVHSRAQWAGVSEAAPTTTYALPRPVLSVTVSLAGWDHRIELPVVDPDFPMLVFAEDGRLLPAGLPLPPDTVWVVHPDTTELEPDGPLQIIVEGELPLGWAGWRLRQVALTEARALGLADVPGNKRPVRGHTRPRILVKDRVPGVTTPYGSPVHAAPPEIWLPGQAGVQTDWLVEVRRSDNGETVVSRRFEISASTTVTDLWEELPRPLVGSFDITVRGPLARGARRTVFLAEGLEVTYRPRHRLFGATGLIPAQAELRSVRGGRVHPERLDFAHGELSRLVELCTDRQSEPLVVTPPHVQVLRERAGESTTWSTGPLRLSTESFAEEPGVLLVRIPEAKALPSLQVVVGGKAVQEVAPSGRAQEGVARYELVRAADTVAEHRYADLALGVEDVFMPLAFVRPRRLASGAVLAGDRIVLHEAAQVAGLTAAVYPVRAPWREPLVVPVADGAILLPPELRAAGPLLVYLQVDDPWTFTEWPRWPERYLSVHADGHLVSADPEETALSRFLADEADLPESVTDLGRLWRIIDLAGHLRAPAEVRRLVEQCSRPLRERPATALAALADLGLDSSRLIALLVGSGLAATAVPDPAYSETALRVWPVLPVAALLLAGVSDPECLAAAERQCGDVLTGILREGFDRNARVGQFGPEVNRMKLMTPEQFVGLWQAAQVVPRTLLDADTRTMAARRLFDARGTEPAKKVARMARHIVLTAHRLIARSRLPRLADQLVARENREESPGWFALPAASAALALLARLAAHGDADCRVAEQALRPEWFRLAVIAPDLVAIDLVLAELLITADSTAHRKETETT